MADALSIALSDICALELHCGPGDPDEDCFVELAACKNYFARSGRKMHIKCFTVYALSEPSAPAAWAQQLNEFLQAVHGSCHLRAVELSTRLPILDNLHATRLIGAVASSLEELRAVTISAMEESHYRFALMCDDIAVAESCAGAMELISAVLHLTALTSLQIQVKSAHRHNFPVDLTQCSGSDAEIRTQPRWPPLQVLALPALTSLPLQANKQLSCVTNLHIAEVCCEVPTLAAYFESAAQHCVLHLGLRHDPARPEVHAPVLRSLRRLYRLTELTLWSAGSTMWNAGDAAALCDSISRLPALRCMAVHELRFRCSSAAAAVFSACAIPTLETFKADVAFPCKLEVQALQAFGESLRGMCGLTSLHLNWSLQSAGMATLAWALQQCSTLRHLKVQAGTSGESGWPWPGCTLSDLADIGGVAAGLPSHLLLCNVWLQGRLGDVGLTNLSREMSKLRNLTHVRILNERGSQGLTDEVMRDAWIRLAHTQTDLIAPWAGRAAMESLRALLPHAPWEQFSLMSV